MRKSKDNDNCVFSITKDTHAFFSEYNESSYIISHDKSKIVVVEENNMKYTLHNDTNKEIIKYHIDGGMVNDNDVNKCDYGIYTEDELLILVELKGRDYQHAVKQILSTTKLLGITKGSNKVRKLLARVVLSKGANVPKLRTTELTELKNLLVSFGGNILPKSKSLEEPLSRIQ